MKIRRGFVSNSSSSSYVVVGLKIDRDKLFTEDKERSCDCKVEGIEALKFCPNCGKNVFRITATEIPQFDECDEKLLGYDTHYAETYGVTAVFAMVLPSVCVEDGATKIDIPDNLPSLKSQMRGELEPLGLWNEDDFGIWSIYESG